MPQFLSKTISSQGKLLLLVFFALCCISLPTKGHVNGLLNDDNIHCLLFLTESTMKLNSGSPRREPVTCQYFLSDFIHLKTLSCLFGRLLQATKLFTVLGLLTASSFVQALPISARAFHTLVTIYTRAFSNLHSKTVSSR